MDLKMSTVLMVVVLLVSGCGAINAGQECTGTGYFRDPNDCAKLFRCTNGKVTHRFVCGEGKLFNDITKTCEEPRYVNCLNSINNINKNDNQQLRATLTSDKKDDNRKAKSKEVTDEKSIKKVVTTTMPETTTKKATKATRNPFLKATKSPKTPSTTIITTTTTELTTQSSTSKSTISPNEITTTQSSESTNDSLSRGANENRLSNSTVNQPDHLDLMKKSEKNLEKLIEKSGVKTTEKSSDNDKVVTSQVKSSTKAPAITSKILTTEAPTTAETAPTTTEAEATTTVMTTTEAITATKETTIKLETDTQTLPQTATTTIPTTTTPTSTSPLLPVIESTIQNATTRRPILRTTEHSMDKLEPVYTPLFKSDQTTTTVKSKKKCPTFDDDVATGSNDETMNQTNINSRQLRKMVCYFTNWSRYRPNFAKFTPENVNPFLCTHINYAFAVLDNETLTIKSSDPCTDIENGYYKKIVALKMKNPSLKVLLSLGGWVDSDSDKYSRLVRNSTARRRFVSESVRFLNRFGFDGLDIDWEFPRCWQNNCTAGPEQDRTDFASLIKELRKEFDRQPVGLLLTAAVSAVKEVIDKAYDIQAMADNLDFINLMAYDYHTIGSRFALHHSHLDRHPKSPDPNENLLNVNFSVNYWLAKRFPSEKLVLGMPMYGRSFKLATSVLNSMGARVEGQGAAGQYTNEAGFLAYYEVCLRVTRQQWAKRVDTLNIGKQLFTSGPYAHQALEWVGYDDKRYVMAKVDLIKMKKLAGAMVWAMDLDDFAGECCNVKYPLIKTISHQLGNRRFDLDFFCP